MEPSANIVSPPPVAGNALGSEWKVALIGLAVVLGWWINDLSFQWASLVEYRFGWLVVVLVGFIAWERWPSRPQQDSPVPGWITLLIAAAGLPLVLAAELFKLGVARTTASSFILSLGCFLFACAVMMSAVGPRTLRHFLFPLGFFFLAVPLPKVIWNPIIFSLQSMIATVNVETLNLLGIPAERQGHVIRMGTIYVGVDEACSGIRSLQSSVMAALFVGELSLRRRSLKILFLISGVILAVAGNYLRSFYLSWVAFHSGTDRLKDLHDTAGWSILIFTFVGVCLLSLVVSKIDKHLEALTRIREEQADPDGEPTKMEGQS